ncbi:hypothetical protein BN903_53 [Halorubrum sp. AJ67]|nr:hypothetical protein BN903_53 [Halorubrum sp. AJ67]
MSVIDLVTGLWLGVGPDPWTVVGLSLAGALCRAIDRRDTRSVGRNR